MAPFIIATKQTIVMIGVGKELPMKDGGECELHRLLGTLFSKRLTIIEKMNILEEDLPSVTAVIDEIKNNPSVTDEEIAQKVM